MKKLLFIALLVVGGAATGISSTSAQCTIDDIYEKYRTNERFNSVNMSKEMLAIVANQRNSEGINEEVKNIKSVKILSIKVPESKSSNSYSVFSAGSTVTTIDGDVFSTSTTDSKVVNESVEKKMKEKLAQKEAEQKKKMSEITTLKEQIEKDANSCIEASKYAELMSVNEDGKLVKYFAKMEAEKIKEFVVVTKSDREYSLIIIKGDDVKIQSVSRLSYLIPSAKIDVDDYIN